MDRRFRYEISVGLFVIAAALILGYISLKISRVRVRDGIDIHLLFSHACSLVKDAPVAVAGVEVGHIKDLRVQSGKALITVRVSRSAELRRDCTATIRSKSLLGEQYLEMTPLNSSAPLLQNEDTITATTTPVQIDQMISWFGRIIEGVDPGHAAALLNALADDPNATRRIIKNADELLAKLSALDAPALKDFIQQMKIRARLF